MFKNYAGKKKISPIKPSPNSLRSLLQKYSDLNSFDLNKGILLPNSFKKDLNFCPKCGSRNLSAVFCVPTGSNLSLSQTTASKSKCVDCQYEDEYSGFEKTNIQEERDKKLNSILDGF